MPSIINADNGVVSGTAGLKQSADTTGNLVLQSNGNTAVTINTSLNATFAANLSLVGNIVDTGPLWINTTANGNITLNPNGTGQTLVTTSLSATGNITGGNILTAGLLSGTGNITGGNILTAGLLSGTGNITGGNILTAGLISATGAITTGGDHSLVGNIVDTGSLWINTTANGNITLNPTGTGQTFITTGLSLAGNITSRAILETATITATAPPAPTNFDIVTQAVQYYTANATANVTLNFRGNSTVTANVLLATGQSTTIALLWTNGATAYYPNLIQVDGSTVTPKWQGGTAVTAGNANATDVYSFTIIKTAATPTYVVLASQTKFA